MSRAEDILQAIYEDPDLRDNLTDDEAEVMLKWAETELARLDAEQADETAFEEAADQLRRLLKGINQWIGHKGDPPEEQAAMIEKIGAAAAGIGRTLAAPAETLASAQAAPDEMAMLQSILARLSGEEAGGETPLSEPVGTRPALSALIDTDNAGLAPRLDVTDPPPAGAGLSGALSSPGRRFEQPTPETTDAPPTDEHGQVSETDDPPPVDLPSPDELY